MRPHPGPVFVASRALRINPVFLLFNSLALLLHLVLDDAPREGDHCWMSISNILIIGYASPPRPPLNPAWSLDMTERCCGEQRLHCSAPSRRHRLV